MLFSIRSKTDRARRSAGRRRRPKYDVLEGRTLLSAGELDPTFGAMGRVVTDVTGTTSDQAQDVAVTQPDGKVVITGQRNSSAGSELTLVRYNTDGSVDTSFGASGQATPTLPLGVAGSARGAGLALDSSGRIIMGIASANQDFEIIRLTTAGALDTSFGTGGTVAIDINNSTDRVSDVAIDSHGRIVAAGVTVLSGASGDFAAVRLNADGTLDPTFGIGGKSVFHFGGTFEGGNYTDNSPEAVAIDPSDRVLVAGWTQSFTNFSGSAPEYEVGRLNADGTVDSQFGVAGRAVLNFGPTFPHQEQRTGVVADSAGRVIVVGSPYNPATGNDFVVARLNAADGTPDATYGNGGEATVSFGAGVTTDLAARAVIDASGRLVVLGTSSSDSSFGPGGAGPDFAIARLKADGTLDPGFSIGGKTTISFGNSLSPGDVAAGAAIDPAGRIVVIGYSNRAGTNTDDIALARLKVDGTLDAGFDGDGKVTTNLLGPTDDIATSLVATQPDGKTLLMGTSGAGLVLTRYNGDGRPDASFGIGGKAIFPTLSSLQPRRTAIDSSGRIVVVLYTGNVQQSDFAVMRLNANGTLDTSFGSGGMKNVSFDPVSPPSQGTFDLANDLAIDHAGRIVVVGSTSVDGLARPDFAVMRLNGVDGTLDSSFGTGGLVRVAFLNGTNTAADIATGVAIDSADRIIVAGTSNNTGAVARLNANGTLDSTFGSNGETTFNFAGSQFVDSVAGVVIDPAGRIVVAGTVFDGVSLHSFAVARLNAGGPNPGSLDASFGAGGSTALSVGAGSAFASALAINTDGEIAVAGTAAGFAVGLLKADGNPDVDFGLGGKLTTGVSPVSRGSDNAIGVKFDSAGRIVVAGTAHGSGNGDLAVVRLLGHDSVIEASTTTFAANLKAAIASLRATPPAGTARVVVHVTNSAQMSAIVAAVASQKAKSTGPIIEIQLDAAPGVYTLGRVTVPAGLRFLIDGDNGAASEGTFGGSATPALTLVSGDVMIRDGARFTSTANAPTLLVQGGRLTVRSSTIEESTTSAQAGIAVTGGVLDLGSSGQVFTSPDQAIDPNYGGNSLAAHGPGAFIHNTGPNDVTALGNSFQIDGVSLTDNFRIEDRIDHAIDGLAVGMVSWVANNVFVSTSVGDIQPGVDHVPSGGVVNVETGTYPDYFVGNKLLTIRFAGGATLAQQADSLDPSRRTLVVYGDGTFDGHTKSFNDTINFDPGVNPGDVVVSYNNLPKATFHPTGRLMAHGGMGKDVIQVADGITLSAWLYGDDGDDRLKGGGGDDVLIGGAGDDVLKGGAGRDLLIGGLGADQITGNGGDDILIAGGTIYDNSSSFDAGNEAAFSAVMAEWTRKDRTAAQRIAALSSGVGPNAGYALNAANVYDDGASDTLIGGNGDDWFLFDSALDSVTDP